MAVAKLSAPVGLAPRQGEGPSVRNKGADVIVLRKMFAANGVTGLGEGPSVDTKLLKAIEKHQKKIGFKKPDMVVDPGGKTEKALFSKYAALVKEEQTVKMVMVRWKGQDLRMTEKDHARMKLEVFKELDRYIKSLIKGHKLNMKIYQEYLDTAQLKDGIMNAVTQAIIMNWSVDFPSSKIAGKSITAIGALERAVMSKDLKALDKALPEAEKAKRAFDDEMKRFLDDFVGNAKTTATVCNVTSGVSFAVVGVLATPVLVGAGMSAGAAAVVSSGSVAILQSSTQELGKHASGQKVTVWESVTNVAIDGTIGFVTGGIGGKIPPAFGKKLASYFAGKLAASVAMLSTKKAEQLLVKYFLGAGQETLKSAISEACKMMGKIAKSGKAPTEKDFEAAVQNIVAGGLFGGMVSSLSKFNKSWTYKNKNILQGQIFPDRFAKLAKNNNIPNTLKVKLYANVLGKVQEEAGKAGFNVAIDQMKGSEKPADLEKMAEKALKKDKRIEALIDKEMKKAMNRLKIETK